MSANNQESNTIEECKANGLGEVVSLYEALVHQYIMLVSDHESDLSLYVDHGPHWDLELGKVISQLSEFIIARTYSDYPPNSHNLTNCGITNLGEICQRYPNVAKVYDAYQANIQKVIEAEKSFSQEPVTLSDEVCSGIENRMLKKAADLTEIAGQKFYMVNTVYPNLPKFREIRELQSRAYQWAQSNDNTLLSGDYEEYGADAVNRELEPAKYRLMHVNSQMIPGQINTEKNFREMFNLIKFSSPDNISTSKDNLASIEAKLRKVRNQIILNSNNNPTANMPPTAKHHISNKINNLIPQLDNLEAKLFEKSCLYKEPFFLRQITRLINNISWCRNQCTIFSGMPIKMIETNKRKIKRTERRYQ
jgi:hypothetical protein